MLDIAKLDPWLPMQHRIAKTREWSRPRRWEIAELLEGALGRLDAPDDVRSLIGSYIQTGSDGRRGAPERGWPHWARVVRRRMQVHLTEAGFRHLGVRAPKRRALEVVAAEEGLEPESLKRDVVRGLRGAPWGVRVQGDRESVRRVFVELLELGEITAHHDRGVVWTERS